MATGTSTLTPGVGSASASGMVEHDRFIDKQLRRTRAQVRTVDAISGLLVGTTASLVYFFAVALLDHWAIAGGLPGWARLAALGAYAVVAGWYFLSRLLPLFIRRINPLYAAETIERTQASLKNSLLNFLMFRARPQDLPESVFQAVKEQAASRLAHVPIETVVDRSKLINVGYALAGVLAVCALYKVLSPKDPLTSAARVVMPWADILPPTRVTIDDIKPGSSKAFRGQKITVSAEVRGLERDDKVRLIYTTADSQTVDRAVEMHLPQDGYRYTCELPPDDDGLQQTLRYRILAGDAKSHEHTISVVAAPTIVVDSLEYEYPGYTGLLTQKIEHQGDIKGIEGTRVIVHAVTNQPIKQAGLDFDCDEHEDLPLAVDGVGDLARGATATFSLALESDHVTPIHASYQLWFKNDDGNQNQQPIRHTIEVTPDLPPEIEFLAPRKDEVLVREGDALPIELTASDPDFALKQVKLIAEVDGRRLVDKSLVKIAWRGQLNHKFRLSTREHQLKAGDVVQYWASAEDIKSPKPNVVESARRRVRIVPRDAQGQSQPDQEDGQGQPPLEGEPDAPKKGKQGDQSDQASDDGSQEGEKQQGGQADDRGQEGGQEDGQNGDPRDSQSGEDEPQQDRQGGKQPGDKPQRENTSGESQEAEQPGREDGDSKPDPQQVGKQGEKQSQDPSGASQPAGSGDPQTAGPKETVPNDGSRDGDVFDKAQKHLQEKKQQDPQGQNQDQGDGQTKNENPGAQQSQGDNKQTPGANEGGHEKPSEKKPPTDDSKEGAGDETGNENRGEEQSGQSNSPKSEKKPGEQDALQGQEQAGHASDDAKPGENSQKGQPTDAVGKNAKQQKGEPSKGGQSEKIGEKSDQGGRGEHAKGVDREGGPKPDDRKSQDKTKGGSAEQEKGESGAGRKSRNDQGAPEAQGDNQQKNKTPKPSAGQQDDEGKTEAQSPTISDKQSDSKEGESEGDRSGGGKAGGGQKANQPGTGGAGKNTASDEGAGKSSEQGDGETSGKAGDQQVSDSPTGKSSNEAGRGLQSKPSDPSGQGQPGQNPQGQGSPSDEKSQQPGTPGKGAARGKPSGGGDANEQSAKREPEQGPEPGGEQANLEYARKATDLVLDHLRDQLNKGEVDPKLLDELGWTAEDLEKFVRRWEQMRAQARDENRKGEAGKRELDATLRSLGLRPRGTELGGDRAADDSQRGLKDSRRTSPPAEYAEQYKAYTQGTARSGK